MGEKLNKMTYPTYPIYDLNDRNAATPVNIKELEEEDEAELLSTQPRITALSLWAQKKLPLLAVSETSE